MRLALFGHGKTGKQIEKIAQEQGHEIVCIITGRQQNLARLSEAEICIDFSHPEAVLDHIDICIDHKKNLVLGTTGWEMHFETVRKKVKQSEIGMLYSPNFSIGMHLFLKIVESCGELIRSFEEYDVGGYEIHHHEKKDAPSGTALEIVKRLALKMRRTASLEMASVRVGHVPGKHVVLFDSLCDTISISHEARNRSAFALGAIESAKWLLGRKGLYQMDDFFGDKFHET